MNIMSNKLCVLVGAALAFCSKTSLAQVELPELPYEQDALEPYISAETVSFHYGKHHQGYVNNVNAFIEDDPSLAGLSLWKLMKQTEGGIFNNVAQIYNHNIYWNSLSPTGGGEPTGDLYTAIISAFGSYEEFQTAFTTYASGHFGSGWAWLMMHEDGSVDVVDSHDAENPVSEGLGFPLLVCDVWEHAYYLDYQNLRSDYIEGWWALVNWDYAESEYARVLNKYKSTAVVGADGVDSDKADEAETAAVDEDDAEADLNSAAGDVLVHGGGLTAGVAGAVCAASSAMLLLGL